MTTIITLNQPEQIDTRDVGVDKKEAVALCKGLGLKKQATRYETSRDVSSAFAKCLLTEDECLVWLHYCPTRYGDLAFGEYAFDLIPLPVLKLWKRCKQDFAFDSFELRTTERTQHQDPILLGRYGSSTYLLARWGDEAPQALSFDDICRSLVPAVRQLFIRCWKANSTFFCTEKSRQKTIQEFLGLNIVSNYGLAAALHRLGHNVFGK